MKLFFLCFPFFFRYVRFISFSGFSRGWRGSYFPFDISSWWTRSYTYKSGPCYCCWSSMESKVSSILRTVMAITFTEFLSMIKVDHLRSSCLCHYHWLLPFFFYRFVICSSYHWYIKHGILRFGKISLVTDDMLVLLWHHKLKVFFFFPALL